MRELGINSVEAPAEAVPATSDCVLSVMKPGRKQTIKKKMFRGVGGSVVGRS